MVQACHMLQQPLLKHPSGHIGGLGTPWLAEDVLDGQHQKMDISAYARSAHKCLLPKRLDKDLC